MLKLSGSAKNCVSCKPYLDALVNGADYANELWAHLEVLFSHPDNLTTDGKVWMHKGNKGIYNKNTWDDKDSSTWTWQLDHIIPRADLPHSSMEEENFRKCWALENLRPLSAKQNIIDGSTRIRHRKNKKL